MLCLDRAQDYSAVFAFDCDHFIGAVGVEGQLKDPTQKAGPGWTRSVK